MVMSAKKLTKREAMFCRYLSVLGDARQAAVLAGFELDAQGAAAELITRDNIMRECEKISGKLARLKISARRGLERLAFGGVGDALGLLFIDEIPEPEYLRNLDLFCVSEIKRPKGGGVEIKFFDRLKALGVLLAHDGHEEMPGAASLYRALEAAAASHKGRDSGED